MNGTIENQNEVYIGSKTSDNKDEIKLDKKKLALPVSIQPIMFNMPEMTKFPSQINGDNLNLFQTPNIMANQERQPSHMSVCSAFFGSKPEGAEDSGSQNEDADKHDIEIWERSSSQGGLM